MWKEWQRPVMASILPESQGKVVAVSHRKVTEDDAQYQSVRAAVKGEPHGYTKPATYAQLWVDNELMMSDTDMEWHTGVTPVLREIEARPDCNVLIGGLGLGLIQHAIARNIDRCKPGRVTVVEQNTEVIRTIRPTLPGNFVCRIVHADIFDWQPPKDTVWDVIFFDIWPTICTENLGEMTKLHRRFARRKAPGGWMASWRHQEDLRYMRSRGR